MNSAPVHAGAAPPEPNRPTDAPRATSPWGAAGPTNRWDKLAIAWFVVLIFALGGMVEYRSAFLSRRMGDLDVFLRAAWAVRNGEDLYLVSSDNDWHYIYPPLYAIILTPLADPPRGMDTTGYLPYPVSVAVCFVLNLMCLFLGVHVLAGVLERRAEGAGTARFSRRWWWLRLFPILVCCLPIGHTLMRGQANVIVLATLCAALACWLRGWNFRAGVWLAAAICIKVIPVYLLVYPLWKRDWRGLAGCFVGCLFGLVLIPGAVFGPTQTVKHYETYGRVFFGPFLKLSDDTSRKDEILGHVNATDSVGVRSALHNLMHPDPWYRPADLDATGKVIYLLLGFVMTFVTLWPGRFRIETSGKTNLPAPKHEIRLEIAAQLGGLIVLMTIFSPVCHSHYLLFCLPIVMVLCAKVWETQPTLYLPWLLWAVFGTFWVTMALAYLPGLEVFKDRCMALFATLLLWVIPIAQVWHPPAYLPAALPSH